MSGAYVHKHVYVHVVDLLCTYVCTLYMYNVHVYGTCIIKCVDCVQTCICTLYMYMYVSMPFASMPGTLQMYMSLLHVCPCYYIPTVTPLTPTTNLKMLVAAASSAFDREKEESETKKMSTMDTDDTGTSRKMKSLALLCKKYVHYTF